MSVKDRGFKKGKQVKAKSKGIESLKTEDKVSAVSDIEKKIKTEEKIVAPKEFRGERVSKKFFDTQDLPPMTDDDITQLLEELSRDPIYLEEIELEIQKEFAESRGLEEEKGREEGASDSYTGDSSEYRGFYFEKSKDESPNRTGGKVDIDSMLNKASEAILKKDYNRAYKILKEVDSISPNNSTVIFNLKKLKELRKKSDDDN